MNKPRRRAVLHRRDPNCFWCRQPTRIVPAQRFRKEWPDDMACLDHMDDRFDVGAKLRFDDERGRHPKGERRIVLACLSCIRLRSQEINAVNVEEQRVRSHPVRTRHEARAGSP